MPDPSVTYVLTIIEVNNFADEKDILFYFHPYFNCCNA